MKRITHWLIKKSRFSLSGSTVIVSTSFATRANAAFTARIKRQRRRAASQSTAKRRFEIIGTFITTIMRTIVFLCVVAVTSAGMLGGPLPEKPKEFEHKEGCYVREINDVVPFGKTVYPIGYCYEVRCSRSGMLYASCGVAHTSDPKCYLTETDVTKPYPHCCPDIKCNA
ncbi:hypothetical protein EVAR_92320_1 [Eumeta japonica]|uniref:Single domain-containing protein n=1 Tax=Eumeta variegata TaxID=151549 RepID=A0A4C1TLR0_EUMVA|nr:hypothetical protein EVAR_92320_1 [Eumeta japonica]